MTRKKMVVKIIRAIKKEGIKLRLPVTATLAKAHVRGNITPELMAKLGAIYLRKSGCECCYTSSIYALCGNEIEIAYGRLWSIPLSF